MKRLPFILFSICTLIFSTWLMFHTFSYDAKTDHMVIASKAWSDFGAHIPLIRSFSKGENLQRLLTSTPIESPLFPGEPIRYHFLFDALVGFLEKFGFRIDWAMNIPSIIGFGSLLILLYILSKTLFQKTSISILSVVFFLLNGSLSFLEFFKLHPLSPSSLRSIVASSQFSSFGPWDGKLVSAFWNLNIYTNQRHLALSYALAFLCIVLLLSQKNRLNLKKSIFMTLSITIIISILLFLNQATALCLIIFLGWFFLVHPPARISIMIAGILVIPSFLYLTHITDFSGVPAIDLGYLTPKPHTIVSFITYWFYNLGLHSILVTLGIFLIPKRQKLLLIPPLLLMFILPNVIRFSPDMINNHKFFNFMMLFGNMVSAYVIISLWHFSSSLRLRVSPFLRRIATSLLRLTCIICCFFLTLSGIIDFFPIANDRFIYLSDDKSNPDIVFFEKNTPTNAIILNSTWFYHPASLAGRSIFSGYTYFSWSYGYTHGEREREQIAIYQSLDKTSSCSLLKKYSLSFIELSDTPESFIRPNRELFQTSFVEVYRNDISGLSVYDVKKSCGAR